MSSRPLLLLDTLMVSGLLAYPAPWLDMGGGWALWLGIAISAALTRIAFRWQEDPPRPAWVFFAATSSFFIGVLALFTAQIWTDSVRMQAVAMGLGGLFAEEILAAGSLIAGRFAGNPWWLFNQFIRASGRSDLEGLTGRHKIKDEDEAKEKDDERS